jgi:serine/threonine protein kinase
VSAGRYQLLDELGRGGMGTVHRARHVELDRVVALKRVSGTHASVPFLERFRREARGMSRVTHPNLVRVFETGDLDGQPYIAMELVDGKALDEVVRMEPVEVRRRADALMRQIAGAVGALHQTGMVHRDLKTANVMVERSGRAVVMDFGLVKDLSGDGTQITSTGEVIGTPRYLAPELFRGVPAGPRSDVWALGCIYYEMLSGRALFEARSLGEVLAAIAAHRLPDLATTCPDLPAHRRAVLERMLARDPAARPADAREVLELLDAAAAPAARPRARWVPWVLAAAGLAAAALGLARRDAAAPPPASASPSAPVASTSPPRSPEVERLDALEREIAALKLGTPESRRLGREYSDLFARVEPAARPSPNVPTQHAAMDSWKDDAVALGEELRVWRLQPSLPGEERARQRRAYRQLVDRIVAMLPLVDATHHCGGLPWMLQSVSIIVDRWFDEVDAGGRAKLLELLRALHAQPGRETLALSALATLEHERGDHRREAELRWKTVDAYEQCLLALSDKAFGKDGRNGLYALLADTICSGSDRPAAVARVRDHLARLSPRIRLAPPEIGPVELEKVLAR